MVNQGSRRRQNDESLIEFMNQLGMACFFGAFSTSWYEWQMFGSFVPSESSVVRICSYFVPPVLWVVATGADWARNRRKDLRLYSASFSGVLTGLLGSALGRIYMAPLDSLLKITTVLVLMAVALTIGLLAWRYQALKQLRQNAQSIYSPRAEPTSEAAEDP
jgi:hypothetical protein